MNLYLTELIYQKDLIKAAKLLLSREVVAFPTETVYGLGASIFSEDAIRKIFTLKGRPSDNPLIAHIYDLAQVEKIARGVPKLFYKLAERFAPGPLTMIIPKAASISPLVSGGLDSIAIRMPGHEIALELLKLVEEPLVAPSANLSGKPSSTEASHVLEDFGGKIPAVVVGETSIGIESTVVSLLNGNVTIMRPGSISKEVLEEFLQEKILVHKPKQGEVVLSPGLKYRHYAPNAKVTVFFDLEEAKEYCKNPRKKQILCNGHLDGSLPLTSRSFYANLRMADRLGMEEVVIVCDANVQANAGLMNRIEKASGI